MALTLPQAALAGQIAAQLSALQVSLAAAQQALRDGTLIASHGLTMMDSKGKNAVAVTSQYQLGSMDTISILNTLVTAYENSIVALTAQLAGM